MANEIELFNEVLTSNLPAEQKSTFRKILDRVSGGKATQYLEKTGKHITGDHAAAAGALVRQGTESAAVGFGLGYLDAKLGGLDIAKVPLDLAIAAPAGAASIAAGSHEIATELRNVASTAIGVYAYRNGREYFQKRQAQALAHGEDEENDPILQIGKKLKGSNK